MSARDRRYTIAREWCGFLAPQWCVRFCGVWIGSQPTRQAAETLREAHAAQRAATFHADQAAAEAGLAAVRFSNARRRAA